MTSKRFCRLNGDCRQPNFYYEAIRVQISQNGNYTIRSISNIDTYGYIYNHSFDPWSPVKNILQKNDNGYGRNQFNFDITLYTINAFILVITTTLENVFGPFSIHIFGPGNVTFLNQ